MPAFPVRRPKTPPVASLLVAVFTAMAVIDAPGQRLQPAQGTPTLAVPPDTPTPAAARPADAPAKRTPAAPATVPGNQVPIRRPNLAPTNRAAVPSRPVAAPKRKAASNANSRAPGRILPHNPKPVAQDARHLIARAYQLGQTADSEEDYSRIIALCQRAVAATEDKEAVAYVNQLMSWAHNRRGQEMSDRAKTLAESDSADQARAVEQQALADYDRAVQLDPGRWRAIHNRGVSHALAGRDTYDAALRDFSRTIELQPAFHKAWFNRAEIRNQLGQYDQAISDYTRTLRLKPDHTPALRGRADTYWRLGQLRRSLDDMNRVVELNPQSASAFVDRADLQAAMGTWSKAAADYQTALRLDENLGRAYLGAAWLMATCPNQEIRSPKYAVPTAEKAVELDGLRDHRYLDTLAAAYASAGMFAEAKDAAQRALQMAPAEGKTAVKARLALYEQEKPFRQPAVQQASATEN
jgi:tetratricopeptide (TPR) repeat protein